MPSNIQPSQGIPDSIHTRSTKQLSSVGLDSRICIWDIATATTITDTISIPEGIPPSTCYLSARSILNYREYSIILFAPVVYVQCGDERHGYLVGHRINRQGMRSAVVRALWLFFFQVVQLWDPRTGKRQLKLMGHKDNIKALLLNAGTHPHPSARQKGFGC